MFVKKKKLLIVSLHLAGGCFQYSNELIAHLPIDKEIWIPRKVCEVCSLKGTHTLFFYGYPTLLRLLSLAVFLVRILIGAMFGCYSGLLLCGFTSWDYWIMKVWRCTRLPSYFVVHDGKMHLGETEKRNQQQLLQIMRWSTHLIFLSDYVRKVVKDNFNIEKPSIIVPHGLIDYGLLPKIQKKEDAKPTLLFLGRVSRYKGVELLLEAIKQVPNELYDKLIIAGKWSYKNESEYNHEKIEIIDKFLSSDEILHYIALADIMVFPYIEATQSGVATLAINYLRPSISTDVGAFKEQFNNDVTIFVKPDTDELARAINYLLQYPKVLEGMKQSLVKLRDVYSWNEISKKLSCKILKNGAQNNFN